MSDHHTPKKPLTLRELEVMMDLLRPSYEDQQLDRYVRRETWAADILAHPWCPPELTLAQARHIANHMVVWEER